MSENQPLVRKIFDALSLNHGTSRWGHSSTTARFRNITNSSICSATFSLSRLSDNQTKIIIHCKI